MRVSRYAARCGSWCRRLPIVDGAHPARKTPGSFDRTVPLAQTLALIPELRRRFGITRVADLTYLDRIGLPVFSSVVPRSRDVLTVYNGKGVTRDHALAGAVMEAVERQVAGRLTLETIEAVPSELERGLDLEELRLLPAWRDRAIAFVRGHDLLHDEELSVPRALVEWPFLGARIFPVVTTNGLAAGNTWDEAVYHALFELVERHVWSVAHARAHLRPQAWLTAFTSSSPAAGPFTGVMIDDPIGTLIATPTGEPAIDEIIEKIERCDCTIRLLALYEGALPVTIVATIVEPLSPTPMAHIGIGTSWSPVHATLRALTEAVQSRVTDVQGAREDIARANDARRTRLRSHSRRIARLPHGRWHFDGPPAARGRLTDFADRSTNDLGADTRLLLDALREIGVRRAIIVDISPGDLPIAVVRAIAPDLESMIADGRIGRTIQALLGSNVA